MIAVDVILGGFVGQFLESELLLDIQLMQLVLIFFLQFLEFLSDLSQACDIGIEVVGVQPAE